MTHLMIESDLQFDIEAARMGLARGGDAQFRDYFRTFVGMLHRGFGEDVDRNVLVGVIALASLGIEQGLLE